MTLRQRLWWHRRLIGHAATGLPFDHPRVQALIRLDGETR